MQLATPLLGAIDESDDTSFEAGDSRSREASPFSVILGKSSDLAAAVSARLLQLCIGCSQVLVALQGLQLKVVQLRVFKYEPPLATFEVVRRLRHLPGLSAACGLTNASFYHHYPNKEALLRDVLESMHDGLKNTLFAAAYDSSSSPVERISALGRRAKKLFQDDTIGCLMGVVAMDASYSNPSLMEPIRAFMDEWSQAYTHILTGPFEASHAKALGKQLVADYEGAILLARIYQDPSLIDGVTARTVELISNAT